jgi:hypothetical protein
MTKIILQKPTFIMLMVYRLARGKTLMKLFNTIRRLWSAILNTSRHFLAVELPLTRLDSFKRLFNVTPVPYK